MHLLVSHLKTQIHKFGLQYKEIKTNIMQRISDLLKSINKTFTITLLQILLLPYPLMPV